jgi:hypothetical protein
MPTSKQCSGFGRAREQFSRLELDQYITSWDKTSRQGRCMHASMQFAGVGQARNLMRLHNLADIEPVGTRIAA